ncbi:MFS general substrate transporter [Glonium stellatum]|uniref:MFS general substrate transporter n=1 Tax=Glonium stellatum TaxID=574774 RepID=A0A8E2ESU1_9PEZI|nr:MFS general substrate transporter [Glonium stellatum]
MLEKSSVQSQELASPDPGLNTNDVEISEGKGNDIRVLADSVDDNVKTTKDRKVVLIPQPSAGLTNPSTDDPDDPLNWTWAKKHFILASLIMPALLTDFGMAFGTVDFEQQSVTWHMSVPAVAKSISGGIFMQGVGGLISVPFAIRYGRLPILFWSQFLACAMVIGSSLAPSYASFTVFRTLQGFFNTAPQVIGLTIIHDIFFFHERTRKINIWAFCVLVGPYLGPFLSSLILSKLSWRSDFGILASIYGLSLLLIIVLSDETLFNRTQNEPRPKKGILGKILLLTGIHGTRQTSRPTLASVLWHIVVIQIKPHILLTTACFMMLLFMWVIGLVTTVPQFLFPPPYLFTPVQVGLLYLAPSIGSIIGEVWGHWFNDFNANRYIRHNAGSYCPENRLWGCYVSLVFSPVALVLFGQGIAHKLHWIVLAIAWALYTIGQVSATVAISAYLLDTCPKHSAIVSGILNMWRTTGGFCVVYFQLKWVARNGAGTSFGVQAAILAASSVSIVAVQLWGKRWRMKYPMPVADN